MLFIDLAKFKMAAPQNGILKWLHSARLETLNILEPI